jgi:hypothetical protein
MTTSTPTPSRGADKRDSVRADNGPARVDGSRWKTRLLPVVGASLIVGSMGATTSAHATTPSFGSQSAGAIVAQARAAMTSAGSVTASGEGPVSIPGVGKVMAGESDYTSATSGSQILKMTSTHLKPGVVLPSASVLDVGGQLFVEANASFWSSSAGLSNVEARGAANRWVQIQPSSDLYAPAAADLTMPSLMTDLFNSDSFHKGGVRTVDGVRSIAITYKNSGNDSGQTTCYIALGGTHLPVSVTLGGLSLRLRSWGQTQAVAAPTGVVQLSNLLPPTESTT